MRSRPRPAAPDVKARFLLAATFVAAAICASPARVFAIDEFDRRAGVEAVPPREDDVLAPAAGAVSAPLSLLAPAADDTLIAGGVTWLSWEPGDAFAELGRVDEWEAFWSVDDGVTFPFRITPHLDLDVRRVSIEVPDVPTARGRLLLRLGDERRERGVLLPQRFHVAAPLDTALRTIPPPSRPHATVDSAGEPALAHQPGVVAWVEGSRRGGEWRQVRTRPAPTVGAGIEVGTAAYGEPAIPDPAPDLAPRHTDVASSLEDMSGRVSRAPATRLPAPPDILLLGQRRNE